MADIGLDLQQVVGIAIEDPRVKSHHLHQTDGSAVADSLGLQASILSQQHSRQKTG